MPVIKPYQVGFKLTDMFARQTDSDPWKPAVWHDQIRKQLINKAKGSKNQSYAQKRESSTLPEDITSFHADQKDWGEDRSCRPKVLFQFEAPPNWKEAKDEVGMMLHENKIVLDPDNRPVRDFKVIPLTVSSKVEGWLMEAIRRQNHQITPNDFRARMPRDPSGKNLRDSTGKWIGQEKDALCTSGGLDMRMTRWRMSHRCIAWTKKAGSDSFRNYLHSKMTAEQRQANSTEGMQDVTDKGELKNIQSFNLGKYMQRSRKRKTEPLEDTVNDEQEEEGPEKKRSRVLDPRSDEIPRGAQEPTAPTREHGREMDEMVLEDAGKGLEPNHSMKKRDCYMDQSSQEAVHEELGPVSPTLKRGRNVEANFEEDGGGDFDLISPAKKRSRTMLWGSNGTLSGGFEQQTNGSRNMAKPKLRGAGSGLRGQHGGLMRSGNTNFGIALSAYGSSTPRPVPTAQNHMQTQRGGIPGGQTAAHEPELYIPANRMQSHPKYNFQSNVSDLPFESPLYPHAEHHFLENESENLRTEMHINSGPVRMPSPYPVHGTWDGNTALPSGLQQSFNVDIGSHSAEHFIGGLNASRGMQDDGVQLYGSGDHVGAGHLENNAQTQSMYDFLRLHGGSLNEEEQQGVNLRGSSGGHAADAKGNQDIANYLDHFFDQGTLSVRGTHSHVGGDFNLSTQSNLITHPDPHVNFNPGEDKLPHNGREQATAVAEGYITLQPNRYQPQTDPSTSATNDPAQFDLELFNLMYPPPPGIEPLWDEGSGNNNEISAKTGASGEEEDEDQQLQVHETEDNDIGANYGSSGPHLDFDEALNHANEIAQPLNTSVEEETETKGNDNELSKESSGMQSHFDEALGGGDETVRPNMNGDDRSERLSSQDDVNKAITSPAPPEQQPPEDDVARSETEQGKETENHQENELEVDGEFSFLSAGLAGFEATDFGWILEDLEIPQTQMPELLSAPENETSDQPSKEQNVSSLGEQQQDSTPTHSFSLPQKVNWNDPALVASLDGMEFSDEDWASLNWDPNQPWRI